MRYIAILHEWFIDSKGFTIIELEAADEEAAKKEAKAIAYERYTSFNHCAVKVIRVENYKLT